MKKMKNKVYEVSRFGCADHHSSLASSGEGGGVK